MRRGRDEQIMTREAPEAADWLRLIRAEYLEMPGLHLTKPQFCRLWGLDSATCDKLLNALIAAEFLRRTSRDVYVLGNAGR